MEEKNTSNQTREFDVASYEEEHFKAVEFIETLKPGRMLDLPSGSGRLSWLLSKKGHNVVAGDIKPHIFKNPEIPIVQMDLQGDLPFKDNSFEGLFCVEGPEHIENMYHAFREFARVLKTDGRVIVSLPNYSNIEARLRVLFYGIVEPVGGRGNIEQGSIESRDLPHVNRPLYPMLKMALEYAGFSVEKVETVNPKKKQMILFPFYLAIALFTMIKGKKGDKKYWLRDSNSFDILMGGNALMVMAKVVK